MPERSCVIIALFLMHENDKEIDRSASYKKVE